MHPYFHGFFSWVNAIIACSGLFTSKDLLLGMPDGFLPQRTLVAAHAFCLQNYWSISDGNLIRNKISYKIKLRNLHVIRYPILYEIPIGNRPNVLCL